MAGWGENDTPVAATGGYGENDKPVSGGSTAGRIASDLGKSLKSGVEQLPGQLTGLADLAPAIALGARPFTKLADAAGEVTGFQPGKWAKEIQYSPENQQSQAEIDQAWADAHPDLAGVTKVAGAYLRNPAYTANQVAQSVPGMVAGGLGARALMTAGRVAGAGAGALERVVGPKLAAPIAGGVGEGAQQTGQQMDQGSDNPDQRRNAVAALGSGAIDAAIGAGAGRVANALGFETAQTAMAGGTRAGKALSRGKAIAAGAIDEGLLQETLQSAQEQAFQNYAEGKPLGEGVARQAVEGGLAGGVMGAGANVVGHGERAPVPVNPNAGPMERAATLALPAPVVTVDTQGRAKMDGVAPGVFDEQQQGVQSRAPIAPEPVGPIARALPAPAVTVDAQGNALTTEQRNASLSAEPAPGPLETGNFGQGRNSEPTALNALPAPVVSVDGGGTAATAQQRTAAAQQASDAQQAEQQRRQSLGLPQLSQDGDILGEQGKPFKGVIPAGRAARQAGPGFGVVKVDGGYAVRRGGDVTDVTAKPVSEPLSPVDEAAHAAATSPLNDLAQPTDAQKEAGNYKVGHTRIGGMDLSIENPQGSTRSGVSEDGTPWESTLAAHYGYLKGTLGKDGDHVDAFVKPGTVADHAGPVFVVDQINPSTGRFDEHKAVIGASDKAEAEAIYRANYAPGWQGLGAITELPLPAFKSWVKDGTKTKPLGTLPAQAAAPVPAPAAAAPQVQSQPDRSGATVAAGAGVEPNGALTPQAPIVQPPPTLAAKMRAKAGGLSVGMTPNATEPVTVKDGTVHIGKIAAVNFDTGEPVKVPQGASEAQIKQALKDAGTLSKRVKFYGGQEASTTAAAVPQSQAAASSAPTNKEPSRAEVPKPQVAQAPVAAGTGSQQAAAGAAAAKPGAGEVQAPRVERPANWRGNFMQATQVAKNVGIPYVRGRKLADLLAMIDAKDKAEAVRPIGTEAPPAAASTPSPGTVAPPQATERQVDQAPNVAAAAPTHKEQGKPAEPAVESLGKSGPERNQSGDRRRADARAANPFKAFLGEHGIYYERDKKMDYTLPLKERQRSMVQGFPPIFRRTGKQIDMLAQAAVDEGFLLTPNVTELAALIDKTLTRGERVDPQFSQDYMAQVEAEKAQADFPEGDFIPSELEESGYVGADQDVQDRVRALLAQAQAAGLDAESLLEDVAKLTENATEQTYYDAAEQALTAALARQGSASEADRSAPAGGEGAATGQAEGLTAPTRADILAQQAQREAEAQRQQDGGDKPAKARPTTADQIDLLNPQGGIFDAPEQPTASAKPKVEGKEAPQALKGPEGGKGLDHGELSIPNRTSTINAELDRYKADQAQQERERQKGNVIQLRADKAKAKELFAQLWPAMKDKMGARFGAKELRDTLDSMVKWQPAKFIALAEKFQSENPGEAPMFARSLDPETRAANFRRWSNDAPLVTSAQASTYSFKTGQKVVLEAFHGAKRPDRIGSVFQRKRATSGPMAFFTSAPELASSYATGKSDTSLANEDQHYATWFKVKPQGERSAVDIERAWYRLPEETKAKIAELAPRITTDDTGENIVLGDESVKTGNGGYDIAATRTSYDRRGNPLKALVEAWLNSGSLFDQEERFLKVLELAGFPVKDVTFDSPHAEYPSVYKTFVFMQKPLVTSDIPQEVRDALNQAAKRDRSRAAPGGSDMWDKNTRTLREWVSNFNDPANDSNAYVWTSIPDKVTEVFKSMGYDGIIDWSGKGGGHAHPVYIPFAETQVKSATGNKGTFDATKKDITFKRGDSEGSTLRPTQIQRAVDKLTLNWLKKPDIHILDTMADAPEPVRAVWERQNAQGATGNIEGFHWRGGVYLVAEAMHSGSDIIRVLYHESLGHFGLRQVFGNRLDAVMRQIARAKPEEMRAKARQYGLDLTNERQRMTAAEELLAEMAQTRPEIGFVRQAVAAIRTFLRENIPGFDSLKLTDDEIIRNFLAPARAFVENGKRAEPGFMRSETAQASRADQTNTEAFRKWFGDSKVVDEQGKPLVVYHGTTEEVTGGFDLTKTGLRTGNKYGAGAAFFTSNPAAASAYAAAPYRDLHPSDKPNVVPAYLSLKNPVEIDAEDRSWVHVADRVREAQKQGHDGAIIRNVLDHASAVTAVQEGPVDVYVAFRPEQIKSAIGNRGTFDAQNPDINFSRTTMAGATNRQYTPEQQRAMKHVGFEVQQPTVKERAQALWKDAGKKLAQGLVDQFAPVKDLDKQAYGLLRLAKGASGAFETFLHGGKLKLNGEVYDFDDTQRGGVIEKLLIPLQGEHHDFFRWVAANRAERLAAEDREHLFSAQDIADLKTLSDGSLSFDYTLENGPRAGQTTRNRAEAYRDSLVTFNAFNKNALDMAQQSGLIDGASRQFWEHEFYVPFYRVADEQQGGFRGMNIKSGVVRQQAFKQLKGGRDALSADLLDNTLLNWAHLLDAASKNRAAKATLEAAERMGVALEAPADAARQIGNATGNRDGVVWFMDGGKQRFFVVDDPHILTAISGLEFAGMRGPMMAALGTFKHYLTMGVTASPFFKVRNLIRDSLQAIGTAPMNYNPVANVVQGWKLTNPKSDAYFRLMAGGGTIHFGTMLEGSEGKRVQALVESGVPDSTILNSDSKMKAFYRQYIEPGITAYNELGNRGEAINRAAIYEQLTKQGMSHAEASLQARDLMDFSMQGSFTTIRFLAQTVPFWNARIVGLAKLGRAAKEDPARFAAVLGSVTLLGLGLLAAYSDDDDWKKRELWDRQTFWWFKFGGTAFRIPKPFEIGAIASVAEHGAELMMDDEMTGKRFREAMLQLVGNNLSMNPIPQMVKPMLDVYANKDSYTGRPIESMGMERLRPEYRFSDRTSMAARAASTGLNAVTQPLGFDSPSPVQVDQLLRGYFGWLGTFVVSAGDAIARPTTGQPAQATPDYWKAATGGMISGLQDAPSRYVSQMYEQAKEIEQAYGTWHELVKQGKVEEAAAFRQDNQAELAKYGQVERVKRGESFLNQQIKRIERSDIPADDKRERIRQIQGRRDAMSRILAPS
jgi:hypothetical protein